MRILAATTLTGNYRAGAAILSGLVGGLVFLIVVYMRLGVGMTRMNFHMMFSAIFGLVHAGILTAIGVTTVGASTSIAGGS